jgi:hypothetical protein
LNLKSLLFRGRRATPYDTPEIKRLRREIHLRCKNREETFYLDDPKRQALRAKIARDLYRPGYRNEGAAYIIIGPPAAGKSSVAGPLAFREGALIVDSDEAKKLLPEFAGGKYAALVHRESDDIAYTVLFRAIQNLDNIVLPIVGKTPKKVLEMRDLFIDAGYRAVHLMLVHLDAEKCALRAVDRFHKHGRFVDPAYVLYDVGNSPRKAYDILRKQSEKWDSITAYSTDVDFGNSPVLMDW